MANKQINGYQCTILWHVDDQKISHVSNKVLDEVIASVNEWYGKIHDYLGMTINYTVPGKVIICMDDYIQGIINEEPSDMDGVVLIPVVEHLFDAVNQDAESLDMAQAELFHHLTAKLLFLCKCTHPDIQTPVAFSTTRVKGPDTDDYKKLARMIQYLHGAPDLALTLEADDTHMIKWWVDASFAVHPDMRSHTSGTMSLGKGSAYSTSMCHKINTKSSTEAKHVAVNDVMPLILWTRYFLEAQGYKVHKNKVFQDNQSTMLLEKNGKCSSSC